VRSLAALGLIALISLPFWAAAQDDPPPEEAAGALVVGVFAPRIYFQNSLARTSYANAIAAHLTAQTGVTFSGRGFATRGDFEGQVQSGRVQFAVVEAQLQAERGYPALGQGTTGGATGRAMVLAVGAGAPAAIGGLKGRTLAVVAVGAKDKSYIMNHLLQGQVPADWFKTVAARDAQGALGLVKLGKADAAFAFSGNTEGLAVAFQSRPVPLPVFVQVDKSVAADLVAKVRGALGSATAANGVFAGFGAYDAAAVARLKGDLDAAPRAAGTEPVFAAPRSTLPPVPEFLERGVLPFRAPDPAAGLAVPPPPADAF